MITSAANPQIKETSALVSKHKARRESGLFAAEGIKLYKEAPEELIEKLFVSESFEKNCSGLLEGREYVSVKDEIFVRMCDTKTPQGIMTVLKQPEHELGEMFPLDKDPFIVILENVQDPGNIGTIIRTAEGAGVTGVIMTRGCADIFAPKTIRSTMGSVFRVPFIYTDDIEETVLTLKQKGVRIYAAHLKGTTDFDEPAYSGGTALCIGNEGNGLTDELTQSCDVLLKIPMEGKLESLNASAAAAVLMYTVYRKSDKRI